ncbi:MAG: hypothetical protein AAF573_16600 [Bacteroidota bacterium]
MDNFQKQLNKILNKYQDFERIQKHLSSLDKQLKNGYKELDKLNRMLEKQGQDVEQLEKLSLKGIFHKMLGSKNEQLDKERQEYLQVALKRNEHKKSLELLEYEKGILEEKMSKLKNIPAQAEALIKQREHNLMRSGTPVGMRILTISKQIDESKRLKREIAEAIEAGGAAVEVLNEMESYLRSARNWGNWDVMGGRGMTTYVKHSNIDRARARLHKAQHLLNRFEDELRDVYNPRQLNLSLNLDSFTRFIDIFFDNLISDWIVQQRIRNALSNVQAVRDRASRLVGTLDMDDKDLTMKIKQLEKEKKQLIMNYKE